MTKEVFTNWAMLDSGPAVSLGIIDIFILFYLIYFFITLIILKNFLKIKNILISTFLINK